MFLELNGFGSVEFCCEFVIQVAILVYLYRIAKKVFWYTAFLLLGFLCSDPELLSTCNLANLRVKAELGCLDHLSYPIVSTAADEEGDMLSHVEVRV